MTYSVIDITHSNTDITQYVVHISPATDTGTGEIPLMVITLNAKNGNFVTATSGGNTPIADQFTRYKVTFTDQSGVSFTKIYLVDTFKPLKNTQMGSRLELHCFGQEYWLQRLDFAKQFYFADANSVAGSIFDIYNVNKGSLQPTITNQHNSVYNQLPVWTANNYLFNISELSVYNGVVEVVDKLGTSVQNGGANDFFEVRFDDGDLASDPNNPDKITPRMFSSGSTPNVPLIITPSNSIKISEIAGDNEAYQGSLIKAWGDDQSGSTPLDFAKFRGVDESFFLFPDWQNPASTGQPYPQNALVGFDPGTGRVVFKSNINNNSSIPPSNWTVQSEADLLASNGVTGYSPWTTSGSGSALMSCMADPSSLAWGASAFDSNLIVQDGDYYRTFSDIREISDNLVPSSYKIRDQFSAPQFYRGFRILVDLTLGTKGGVFAQNGGKDRFGNSYDNALVQNNGNGTGTYKDWDCVFTLTNPPRASAFLLKSNFECGIIAEAKVYGYSATVQSNTFPIPPLTFSYPVNQWADLTVGNSLGFGTQRANDCFHPRGTMTNVKGTSLVPKNGGGTFGDNSAIQITYTWSPFNTLFAPIVMTAKNYFSAGWWFNWRIPFPSTVLVGAIPVGSLYGGAGNPNQNNLSLEPATVDSLNMHLTPKGNVGFNQIDSECLGSYYGLGIQMKMRFQDDLGNLVTTPTGTVANFHMRAYIFDTSENVVYHDFTIAFNDVWQDMILPFSEFQIYRGRIPLQWGDLNSLTPIPQLNILNVFWWRNIKQIVIQCQDMYDDQGRFKPEGSNLNNMALLFVPAGHNVQLVGAIDSLRFVKPLLCTSGPTSAGYVIEPESLQRKNVTNYFQLKQDVLSMLQVYTFPHREYEVTMNLNCGVRFGDTFYLRDPQTVKTQIPPDVAPDGISANTIKLVLKNGSYYLNKTDGGPGGEITILKGSKRFPPGGV